MSKSTNGPDWTDTAQAIMALEENYGVDIVLSIERLAKAGGGQLKLKATATRRQESFMGALHSVSRSLRTGSGDPVEVAACSFRLIYELERDCGIFAELNEPRP